MIGAARRFGRRAILDRLDDPAWRVTAALVCATLGLLVFTVRVLLAKWPSQFAIFYPDSFSFINAAKLTPFSPSFYVAERPIGFPTLLFLLGRSTVLTVVIQTLLYGIAYLFAASVACRVLRTYEARVLCVFGIIVVGIEPRFALWNTHILSESLGQTLAVASIAAWWLFAHQPSVRQLRWAAVATIGWVTVRDSNVPSWVVVGVPALLIASFWWRSVDASLRRSLRNWGLITLTVCLAAAASQSINGRNRYATMNNIGLRVLDHPGITDPDEKADRAELTEWFVDWGMPLDDALRERAGASSFDNGWDVLTSPDLTRYRNWADGAGQRVMLMSYLRFAPHWIGNLYDDLPALLSYQQTDYDVFAVADRLPDPPPFQIGGPTTRQGLLVWTLVSVGALALTAVRRRGRVAIVLGLALASTFVDLYMAYVGDSVEVLRHMVGPLSRMALVMVLCASQGIDALSEMIRSRLAQPGPEDEADLEPEPEPEPALEPAT